MHGMMKSAVSAFALTFAFVGAAVGQTGAAPSPLNGSWKLDAAASRFTSEPAWKDGVRTYRVDGDRVEFSATETSGSGKPISYSYSAAYDGKPYPMIGNPVIDTITLTRIDARTVRAIARKKGAVFANGKLLVSPDGEHMVFTREVMRPGAAPLVDEIAFSKQH